MNERQVLAAHEAAHALVELIHPCGGFEHVTIVADGDLLGHVQVGMRGGKLQPIPFEAGEALEEHLHYGTALMLVAGYAAERILGVSHEAALDGADGDFDEIEQLGFEPHAVELLREAHRLLLRWRPAWEAIAQALLDHSTLTETECQGFAFTACPELMAELGYAPAAE